ncbi:hypothetical protein HY384_02200 [Candidatus Daviesbacteria bacterium]|nr:hypothetical protein [Candidatus Daviesbacteria bacterium]
MVKSLLLILIAFNIILNAYWLLLGDIHYDIDVSRDFLVIDDIIRNNHLTLLGPRSGAIPGVFHGPLWFYVNLPAFLFGGGNPLIVGWFWFLLSAIFLLVVFWVAKKLFGFEIGLLSALLLSVNSIVNPTIGLKNFYNPYGAVFLSPIFFFSFYKYIITYKFKYLIYSLFILGLIIQFQMAFGVPIFFAITPLIIYLLYKKKRIWHLLSYFILLIPLSSFIIFDLKHNGLQFKALIRYLNETSEVINLLDIFKLRINEFTFNFFDFLSPGKNILTAFYAINFLILFPYSLRKSNRQQKTAYFIFGYLFLGFWVITLFFPGGVGNYFWPLLPLTIIIFCSFYNFIKKEIFILFFLILYLVNFYEGILAILEFKTDVNQRGPHSWAFNLQVAKKIYDDAKDDFGYFNFSPDRFAYQQRYAMIYTKKFFPNIYSFSSIKKPLTYLVEVDPPKDRSYLNGTNWRIADVKIDREPDQVFRLDFIKIEKYWLSDDEIKKPSNPYLQDSLFLQ